VGGDRAMSLKRRHFLALAGGALALPLAVRAQGLQRRIGFIGVPAPGDPQAATTRAALTVGLMDQGWIEGRNLMLLDRWIAGSGERAREVAAALVVEGIEVLISEGTPGTAAAIGATRTIPVVFTVVTDPVGAGWVTNLAHPEANVTGFPTFEARIGGKWLDLMQALVPQLERLGVMYHPQGSGALYVRSTQEAAASRHVSVFSLPVTSVDEMIAAVASQAGTLRTAVVATPDTFLAANRAALLAAVAEWRLPALYPFDYFAVEGGLIAYGVDIDDLVHRAGRYAGRILNGAKVADLPVQQPTKFQMLINMKTAAAQGIRVPDRLLALADRVIE
jgi:putative ABC transport system substrate-binding protein